MSNMPQLDVVTVAIALFTWVIGAELAQYLGPYSVIILGAIGGATWSASAMKMTSRWSALGYVLWMVGLALIATVPLAEILARMSGVAPRWVLAPVAVFVAARPQWVFRFVNRWLEGRAQTTKEGTRND